MLYLVLIVLVTALIYSLLWFISDKPANIIDKIPTGAKTNNEECKNNMNKKGSAKFLKLFVFCEVLFLILSLFLGYAFPTTKEVTESLYRKTETVEAFNWGVVMISFLSTIPFSAILYGIYLHLQNQEEQTENQMLLLRRTIQLCKALEDLNCLMEKEPTNETIN